MKFSVLLSVYYKENPMFMKEALASIYERQTVKPNEVVIVKDGPLTKELESVLSYFKDKYPNVFNLIPLPVNKGLGDALRIGLDYCKYDYVARMDTDDIAFPDRFEKQIKFLKAHLDVSLLGGVVEEFILCPGDLNKFRILPNSNDKIKSFSKYRNPVNHPTVMFKKKDVIDAGSYKKMLLFEDYYLWVRMLNIGYEFANLNEVLVNFRIGNDMIGRRHGIKYIKNELLFLKTLRSIKYLKPVEYLISIMLKIPLRILPKKILLLFYKKILR